MNLCQRKTPVGRADLLLLLGVQMFQHSYPSIANGTGFVKKPRLNLLLTNYCSLFLIISRIMNIDRATGKKRGLHVPSTCSPKPKYQRNIFG